jgi:hypothetical protein
MVHSYMLQPSWRKNLRSTTLMPRASYLNTRKCDALVKLGVSRGPGQVVPYMYV